MKKNILKSIWWNITQLVKIGVVIFIVANLVGIIVKVSDYFPPDFSSGFLRNKEAYFYGIYQFGFFAHIITSPIILFIGLFQLMLGFKKSLLKLHKYLGLVYILLIVFFAAPGGLIMGIYARGGWIGKINFLILSILWIFFTIKALERARKKDFRHHQKFMYRSYILTLSAVNLRLFLFLVHHYIGYSNESIYAAISWGSWLPFLLIFEVYQKMHSFRLIKRTW